MPPDVTKRLLNVDEFIQMAERGILMPNERVELIRGEMIEMSPIGTHHQSTVDSLNALLTVITYKKAIVRAQGPVFLDEYSLPQPDLALLKYRDDYYRTKHPGPEDIVLLIEVSKTSYDFDKKVKAPLYAEAGISEYWIIDLERQRIEIFRNPAEGVYQSVISAGKAEEISIEALGLNFQVSEILF